MKEFIIHILSIIFQKIDTFLCGIHLYKPRVVIYVDGGICSQMNMYLQGRWYAEYGLRVYYDIRWFEVCGKDMYGKLPRTFELTEMWPEIEFKTISGWRRKYYLLFFKKNGVDGEMPNPKTIKSSVYFNAYWSLPSDDNERLFSKYFSISSALKVSDIFIHNNLFPIVGIHVRRGDLASGTHPVYGGVTDGYFLRVVEFCENKFEPKKYLFFSDEPNWVEQNICPYVKLPYEIMRGNKAWEDLYLLSMCDIIVASQGTFGRHAARMNPEAVLIQCDNEYANRGRNNTFYIK